VKNKEMAMLFENIADLLQIKGEGRYRVLAYRRAGEALRALGRDVHDIWQEGQVETIPGVGKAIASKIDEILRTGELDYFERLIQEVPIGLIDVLQIDDVGPKKAALFWNELGITTVEELEKAAQGKKLRVLQGMGERSEERILKGIESLKRRQTDRILIDEASRIVEGLLEELRRIPGVVTAEASGSLRRRRETIGDLDVVVAADNSSEVLEAFIRLPQIDRVRGQGDTKASVELKDGVQAQVWVHPPARFGSALQYATGSQAHNVRLRELALAADLSLSEHGFKRKDGTEILCAEEAEVYETLGLPWIAPEMREDRGEIIAAQEGRLPNLIETKNLRGDLQSHSDWSDGTESLDVMARAAEELGHEYIAITDHSESLGIAQGLSHERLLSQRNAIVEAQELMEAFHILHGVEVEILADGSLDHPDEVLAEMDIVVASLHSSLRQPREKITERLLKAIRNPHVDIIGHPTGRLIGKRDAADLNMELIVRAASEHGVALEINAAPDRLDLNDVHARLAMEAGCLFAISTDAHHPDQLELLPYGVGIARRAWIDPKSVINTWSFEKLSKWLKARS
jgi:DNA polymerase (family 10)